MGLKFLLFTNQHQQLQQQQRNGSGKKIMEGSGDGSPQSSMCMVKAAELFPKPMLEKEEDKLTVRFTELAGESVKYLGQTDDGVLALSNYRLFLLKNCFGAETSVPLGLIESTQVRDLFHLIVNCKDASTVKCSFSTSEQCSEWHRRISLSIGVPETLESLFAFPFHAWASELPTLNQDNEWSGRLQRVGNYEDDFRKEVERLQFDLQGAWRISQANADFKLCPSYPRSVLVPACISDDTLQNVASFRSSRRIPAVVWRHQRTGAVIARCSQPEVGWLGWRNSKDEQLLKALSDACSFDRGTQQQQQQQQQQQTQDSRMRLNSSASSESSPPSPEGSHEEVEMEEPKKILIVDARSYTSAVTNRARGGGCECAEYYPSAEIQFMNLGNIHVIRKSFHALRQLCASQADIPNWLGLLERTLWLQHLSGLLAASMVVCHAIERNGRPVLVHCSDGWDRTPQIVATAQLCLDPYYRTIEGFRVLVEREWLSFGHKFSDRCGHGPGSDEANERCPVFLQWLDCVHQIHRQFPCSFEFDMGYLIKLAQHSHSCLFGTFLCNTVKERLENSVPDRTFSVWPFLSGPIYKNHLYVPNRERVLWPAHNVRDLRLWTEVYLGSWGGNQVTTDYPANGDGVVNQELNGSMTKTRSYGDLETAINAGGLTRRSSDPNMTVDSSILGGALNLSQENSIDSNLSSDREISPDLIDHHTNSLAVIQHTTQKLQNLTQELNQSDEELENNIKNNVAKRMPLSTAPPVLQHTEVDSARTIGTTAASNTSSLFLNGNSDTNGSSIYNFQPIVPELPTKTTPRSSTPPQHLDVEIDENTSRIIKIESYLGAEDDTVDGRRLRIGRPIPATEATTAAHLDMMESVDLTEKSPSPPVNGGNTTNIWHGSIETSTDTLVPLDQYQPLTSSPRDSDPSENGDEEDESIVRMPAVTTRRKPSLGADPGVEDSISLGVASSRHDHKDLKLGNGSDFTQTGDSNGCDFTSDTKHYDRKLINQASATSFYYADSATPKDPIDNRLRNQPPDGHGGGGDAVDGLEGAAAAAATAGAADELGLYQNTNNSANVGGNGNNNNSSNVNYNKLKSMAMEESIIIQPQFQQLEINGKHSVVDAPNSHPQQQQQQQQPYSTLCQAASTHHQPQNQRRRRNSSNSKADMSPNKPTNGSVSPSATNSRFSTPGARSLPLTPPSVPFPAERPPVATLSCPDGLAHALSEQNLRLQQIVYEHRLREEALQRELYATRLALLKRTCQQCSGQQYGNDDPTSMVDSIIENASNCSWEAVDDRSAPSSGANSSQQMITTSVLWVPDYAVSRCTTCQTDFWLGRRKHHCRSCGQIFCAECSENWAPLPDERLYQPVRLCTPCFHFVTARMSGSSTSSNHLSSSNGGGSNMNGSIHTSAGQQQQQQQQQQHNNSFIPSNGSGNIGSIHGGPSQSQSQHFECKQQATVSTGSCGQERTATSCCRKTATTAGTN